MADLNDDIMFKCYVDKQRQKLRVATEQLRKYMPYVTVNSEGIISTPSGYEEILKEYINVLRSFGIDIR